MSVQNRRKLLLGAVTSFGLATLPGHVLAQSFDGFDDDRLYQDGNGQLYRRRGGQYVPYNGRVSNGRPVPETQTDLDAEAYARRRAERMGEPPAAEAPNQTPRQQQAGYPVPTQEPDNGPIDYTRAYAALANEPFPVQAIPYKKFNPIYLRQEVEFRTNEAPGTIVVDPKAHFLYLILPNGRARRYGVGVGKQGFSWSGASTVNSKQAWPDWYPPKEMIARTPKLAREVSPLQSGVGVPGGSRNPLGARAMYLWQNNKDTLFRIHGTTDPSSIGRSVSSGCIRMINQDAIDLFNRVQVGAKVVVLG